jgi:hypothetical protein
MYIDVPIFTRCFSDAHLCEMPPLGGEWNHDYDRRGCLRFERTTLSLYLYPTHSNFALSRQDGNWSSLASVMYHVLADPSSPVPTPSSRSKKPYTCRKPLSVRLPLNSARNWGGFACEWERKSERWQDR